MSRFPMNRRSWLRGWIGGGGLLGMDALFTGERTEAAAVGPNDTIKVTKIESFVLKNSWVFVKISTDAGITWTRLTSNIPTGTINEFEFVTPLKGWSAGSGVFYTEDGGLTWTQGTTPANHFYYTIGMRDELNGFVGGID